MPAAPAVGNRATLLPPKPDRRRPSVVMTSLIDVIFLLVIFFMVTSQLTQFSFIRLAPTTPSAEDAGPASASPERPATQPLVVRVFEGRISIDGRSVAVDQLPVAVTELRARGATQMVMLPGSTATVQDLVFALEAGKEAGIDNITIVERGGADP
jgi:biopolymer transport protein ExbD